MRRLRLRYLATIVVFATVVRTTLAPGEEWPLSELKPSRLVGHSQYIDSEASTEPPVETANFLPLADDPNASDEGDQAPAWGLPPTDVFPICNCDESLEGWPVACDEAPTSSVALLVGYDAWRGVQDDGWENNGVHAGANFGTRLGEFSDLTGIGMQAGGTVGVYNWSGTDYRLTGNNEAQVQGFITYGLFRKATEQAPWSATLVQDWMLNDNFGVFAQNPALSQLRAQVGYATSACNEFGVWGAWRVTDDTHNIFGVGPTTWRPLNQINAYWHHKWSRGGGDTWLAIGLPEQTRLADGGSLGDYIANALANLPLNDRVALYASVTYMHPSASAGPQGSEENAWNFTVGLAFYPGANARSSTVAGQCWAPQLPVASNGSFLVDTNRH